MASPSELSLDMKPHGYSMLLKSFSYSGDHHQHQQLLEPKQLEDFLACLEDERLKIEAFKRELPLCMQLISNAVETLRQKLNAVKSSLNHAGSRPVLEEFIPLKRPISDGETDMDAAAAKKDKSNWMVSAQLWSQTPNIDSKQYDQGADDDHMGLNINSSTLACIQKNPVRAFIPFSKDSISTSPITLNKNEHHLLGDKKLLGSDDQLISEYYPNNMISVAGEGITENEPIKAAADNCTLTTSNTTTHSNNNTNNNSNQPHRKARRCWSPDLHGKFVNALQMLGGSQVATPKQIRELMKVDGLTNDEVKSHLQKYRLHTRRPSTSPPTQHHHSPTGAPAAQLVVLGGIWVPPEYAAAAHHHHHHTGGATTLYHQPLGHPDHQFVHHRQQQHHQQLFHIHQQQQQMQMQIQQQHQVQMQAIQEYNKSNKTPSSRTSHSSPDQSDARGASESIEDEKSESGSWKGGESVERMKGGGCGDRDSVITLKF